MFAITVKSIQHCIFPTALLPSLSNWELSRSPKELTLQNSSFALDLSGGNKRAANSEDS